jgi:hypothetical protein
MGRLRQFAYRQWHQQMIGTETRYWQAVGSACSLTEKAAAIGQSSLKSIGSARLLLRRQPARSRPRSLRQCASLIGRARPGDVLSDR